MVGWVLIGGLGAVSLLWRHGGASRVAKLRELALRKLYFDRDVKLLIMDAQAASQHSFSGFAALVIAGFVGVATLNPASASQAGKTTQKIVAAIEDAPAQFKPRLVKLQKDLLAIGELEADMGLPANIPRDEVYRLYAEAKGANG